MTTSAILPETRNAADHAWTLECSGCAQRTAAGARAAVCTACGQPLLARYASRPSRDALLPRWDLWRYSAVLPLDAHESPVSLGEGLTPMIESPSLASALGLGRLWIKDEGQNPTASFKARGMSAAITRAKADGVPGIVVPTAGNAGAAVAAYAAAAGLPAAVFAPRTTPAPILRIVEALGAELHLVDGHIGDAGKLAMTTAAERGYFNVSTLREPYRVEGMKTMGYELAEQLDWTLPDAVVYPTGGGEGTIGIWKAFAEMRDLGWIDASAALPRMLVAQTAGCAPIVRAWSARAEKADAWENPATYAAGLRVPSPLGDRLLLRVLRESNGDAAAVADDVIREATRTLSAATGIDAAPEGGCALAVLRSLIDEGRVARGSTVVLFNTGCGASYRA